MQIFLDFQDLHHPYLRLVGQQFFGVVSFPSIQHCWISTASLRAVAVIAFLRLDLKATRRCGRPAERSAPNAHGV